MVTKGVVHSVFQVVTWSSFSVTRQHKVSEGIGCFATCLSDGYEGGLRLMEVVSW